MLDAVVQHLVVDLVGVDDQAVLAGDLDDGLEGLVRVQGAGGVVGVDDDDGPGPRRNLGADVVQVGQPFVGLVTHVVARGATGKAHGRRPQGVVGRRHQHFVAGVEQRVHGHHDQLGDAIAHVDVFQRHTLDVLLLGVMHDRLAGREDALGVRIAGRIGQVADHVELDFFGRIKTERGQVADVQLDDLVALVLHLLRLLQHGATDVVTDVGELVGLANGLHGAFRFLAGGCGLLGGGLRNNAQFGVTAHGRGLIPLLPADARPAVA